MAGNGIFMLTPKDKNLNVALETSTKNGTKLIMIQKKFITLQLNDHLKRIY